MYNCSNFMRVEVALGELDKSPPTPPKSPFFFFLSFAESFRDACNRLIDYLMLSLFAIDFNHLMLL